MKSYDDFLKSKELKVPSSGFEPDTLNSHLFDFQRDIVKWALRKGKAALFEDTGLGKTIQQLAWADAVSKHENAPVLILSPLAVSKQTAKEASKFEINCQLCESQDDVINGINITNYEKIGHFDTDSFIGIVLDESSILKSYGGKTTTDLNRRFKQTPYKLCCTATPSPNDFTELGNHAEFLNVMTMNEMLAMFFINDYSGGIGWRLKGHSEDDFFKWIAEWAIMIRNPSDLGYDGTAYNLPDIDFHNVVVKSPVPSDSLFYVPAETLSERRHARKESLSARVNMASKIIKDNKMDQCIIWCNFNDESEALHKSIDGSYEIKGSDTDQHKEKGMIGFSEGSVRYLVSKPSICGFGMNWQNCNNMIFCGLSDSYEQFYQAIRRCYRFGQKNIVHVYVVTSQAEENVLNNIRRKQSNHLKMSEKMIEVINTVTKEKLFSISYEHTHYKPHIEFNLPSWIEREPENHVS